MKIETIKEKAHIVQVATNLGIKLYPNNMAHCFNQVRHKNNDRVTSLKFYPDTESFYCFACSIGGDVIELVKAFHNCSTHDAIKTLEGLV